MNNVAGAAMLIFTLLAPMLVWVAYRLLRGVRGGGRIGLGLGVAAVVLMLLFAANLFTGGDAIEGEVLRKSETVQLARFELIPSVLHILRVEVRTGVEGGGDTVVLALASDAFDRLHEGRPVRLRQVAVGPLRFARLAESPGWSQLPGLDFTGVFAVLASAASLLALCFGVLSPVMRWRGRSAFAALALLAIVTVGAASRPWWMSRPAHAQATVVEVRTVSEALLRSRRNSRSTETFRLPKPYDEVTLSLASVPDADPVTAVDRVDAGSAGALEAGATVAVSFDPGDPRDARLDAGTRSFALSAYSARFGAMALLGAVAAAAIFVAMLILAARDARRRQARAGDGPPAAGASSVPAGR